VLERTSATPENDAEYTQGQFTTLWAAIWQDQTLENPEPPPPTSAPPETHPVK
jgi:hypothetical protein